MSARDDRIVSFPMPKPAQQAERPTFIPSHVVDELDRTIEALTKTITLKDEIIASLGHELAAVHATMDRVIWILQSDTPLDEVRARLEELKGQHR